MSSVACGCHDCCPSAPDITINQTTLELGDDPALHHDEYFAGPGTTFTLAETPYEDASVTVFLNSGAQRRGTDFTISGGVITMTTALVTGDVLHVQYFAVTA